MSYIKSHYQTLTTRLGEQAKLCHRSPDSIQLLAISKTRSIEEIMEAYEAGCRCFGESYIKEAVPKIQALAGKNIQWHFVGPIQSNKTQSIARNFDWVHSVDRQKIALRLSEQRPPDLPTLNICIQVNISGETSKSGVALPNLAELAHVIAHLPQLTLRGLMALPQKTNDTQQQRRAFALLRNALEQLNSGGLTLDTLSMGMTNDWEAAILEGSTIIRVGTGLFGPRVYQA